MLQPNWEHGLVIIFLLFCTFSMKYYRINFQYSNLHSPHFHVGSNAVLVYDSISTPIPSWKPHGAKGNKEAGVGNFLKGDILRK